MKKDVPCKCTRMYQDSFDLLKSCLVESLTLKDPDPEKKCISPHHNVRVLFRCNQLNWATPTKEAYAIYMSVKKLSFYLDQADMTLRSDHLPLKRFLENKTL